MGNLFFDEPGVKHDHSYYDYEIISAGQKVWRIGYSKPFIVMATSDYKSLAIKYNDSYLCYLSDGSCRLNCELLTVEPPQPWWVRLGRWVERRCQQAVDAFFDVED